MRAWSRALRELSLVCACAGSACVSAPRAAAPAEAAAARPDPLAGAHALAPDYVARAYAARRAAASEPTAQARREAGKSVQLLEWAALAEAERITLTRQLTGYEQRIERAELERAALEQKRLELARAYVRDRAGLAERREAEWAFAALLRRGGVGLQSVERDRLWAFLLRRSQALLAAARSLGAEQRAVEDAELQLTAARTARLPERVGKARAALHRAAAALGSARAQASEASTAEQADLVQRLAERGFPAPASQTGPIAIDLLPGSTGMRERVALLAELLPAFPHGPVVLGCGGPGAASGGGCEHAQLLVQSERARVRWQARPPELPVGAIRLILPGYTAGN